MDLVDMQYIVLNLAELLSIMLLELLSKPVAAVVELEVQEVQEELVGLAVAVELAVVAGTGLDTMVMLIIMAVVTEMVLVVLLTIAGVVT